VVVPSQTLAGAERLRHFWLVQPKGCHHVECAGHEGRAVLVGKHGRLFGGEIEAVGASVILHVSGGSLSGQPFAHVAFMSVGSLGQLGGGHFVARLHRLKEAETVSQQH
jgi:hypothetical protein